MNLMEVFSDGKKWLAVAMVVSAIILYLGFTKSYRDCVSALQGAPFKQSESSARMTCHTEGG